MPKLNTEIGSKPVDSIINIPKGGIKGENYTQTSPHLDF